METTAITVHEFVSRNNIQMTASAASKTSEELADKWHREASKWSCVFRFPLRKGQHHAGKTLTVSFWLGCAHVKPPEAAEVLDCLASDACTVENSQSFEEWCSDLGYDNDSRKAEKVFKECQRQTLRLKAFLGQELYDQLVWHTERL